MVAEASLVPLGRCERPLRPVSCMPSSEPLARSSPLRPVLFAVSPVTSWLSSLETFLPGPGPGACSSGWKERCALGLSCWRVSSTSDAQPCCWVPLCRLGPWPCGGWDGFGCLGMSRPACLWGLGSGLRTGKRFAASLQKILPFITKVVISGRCRIAPSARTGVDANIRMDVRLDGNALAGRPVGSAHTRHEERGHGCAERGC